MDVALARHSRMLLAGIQWRPNIPMLLGFAALSPAYGFLLVIPAKAGIQPLLVMLFDEVQSEKLDSNFRWNDVPRAGHDESRPLHSFSQSPIPNPGSRVPSGPGTLVGIAA
jgi:hypothetical protein